MPTYEREEHPYETEAQRTRRELADARAGVQTTHRFISEDLPFLFDLQQYQRTSTRERRGDIIQPVDSKPYQDWQHRKGVALQNAPIHIRCEPFNKDSDLLKVEQSKHWINYHLNSNRFVNYAEVRERWIGGALAARAWAYRWDFVPHLGAHGEVIPRLVDPRMLFFPDGYLTPHDPMCPRLHEVFRIPINEARRYKNWKHTDRLRSDKGEGILDWIQTGGGTARGDGFASTGDWREDGGLGGEGMATFCMTWYRFEDQKIKVERDVPLEPGMRFMECLNEGCGFKSPREYELAEIMGDPAYTLPAQEACANCGATMKRISKEQKSDEQMKYEQGKRLVIVCLNGSVEEPLYDDAWPVADCPTFPYAWLTCEKEPHRAYPESDTSVGRNMTIGRNFTLATIYEQAHSSRAVLLFPRTGIEDHNGMQLDDMDSLADVLYYTPELQEPDKAVQVVQGAPVNSALFELYNLLHGVSKENESGSRVSVAADESKDIPVGTLRQMIDSGNVPTNNFVQAIYAAESISFTNLSCYMRKFYNEPQPIRYRNQQTGQREWASIRGKDMPDIDVICNAGPMLSNVRAEEIQAIQKLAGMPPALRRIAGRSMGIDETLMDELDAAQPQLALAPPPTNGNGNGNGKPAVPQPQMQGAPV